MRVMGHKNHYNGLECRCTFGCRGFESLSLRQRYIREDCPWTTGKHEAWGWHGEISCRGSGNREPNVLERLDWW